MDKDTRYMMERWKYLNDYINLNKKHQHKFIVVLLLATLSYELFGGMPNAARHDGKFTTLLS